MNPETDARPECQPARRYRTGYIRTLPTPADRNADRNGVSAKGSARYETIRAELEARHYGQFVYIDVTSGAYQVAADPVTARRKLTARFPDANLWGVQIGHYGSPQEARGND